MMSPPSDFCWVCLSCGFIGNDKQDRNLCSTCNDALLCVDKKLAKIAVLFGRIGFDISDANLHSGQISIGIYPKYNDFGDELFSELHGYKFTAGVHMCILECETNNFKAELKSLSDFLTEKEAALRAILTLIGLKRMRREAL